LGIAFFTDHDRLLFRTHMLSGIVATFLLCVRVVLGIAGSRYARFNTFPVRPLEVLSYFTAVVTGRTKKYAGNNPGSAVAALLMFALVLLLFISGAVFGGEGPGKPHEAFAYGLLGVIVLHLLGIAWHTLRHRENIGLAMVSGRKEGPAEDGLKSAHPAWGVVILIGTGIWITMLFSSQDVRAAKVTIPLTGVTLQLGESNTHGQDKRDRDDDDD
jgi:cytochrome b